MADGRHRWFHCIALWLWEHLDGLRYVFTILLFFFCHSFAAFNNRFWILINKCLLSKKLVFSLFPRKPFFRQLFSFVIYSLEKVLFGGTFTQFVKKRKMIVLGALCLYSVIAITIQIHKRSLFGRTQTWPNLIFQQNRDATWLKYYSRLSMWKTRHQPLSKELEVNSNQIIIYQLWTRLINKKKT